jgi:zinc D-Ala-D-Ala carboxypeptidase
VLNTKIDGETNMMLSEHFSLDEATISQTASRLGIDNSPSQFTPEILLQAVRTATKLEKVRALIGHPLHIDSFLRCLLLNRALGSKDTSQHVEGKAVDFICPTYGTPLEIVKLLIANVSLIDYDQLILEYTWIHISFCSPGSIPRHQVLSLLKSGGYTIGLTDVKGNKL